MDDPDTRRRVSHNRICAAASLPFSSPDGCAYRHARPAHIWKYRSIFFITRSCYGERLTVTDRTALFSIRALMARRSISVWQETWTYLFICTESARESERGAPCDHTRHS